MSIRRWCAVLTNTTTTTHICKFSIVHRKTEKLRKFECRPLVLAGAHARFHLHSNFFCFCINSTQKKWETFTARNPCDVRRWNAKVGSIGSWVTLTCCHRRVFRIEATRQTMCIGIPTHRANTGTTGQHNSRNVTKGAFALIMLNGEFRCMRMVCAPRVRLCGNRYVEFNPVYIFDRFDHFDRLVLSGCFRRCYFLPFSIW